MSHSLAPLGLNTQPWAHACMGGGGWMGRKHSAPTGPLCLIAAHTPAPKGPATDSGQLYTTLAVEDWKGGLEANQMRELRL